MNKLEELMEALQKREEDRRKNNLLWVLAIIGAVAAVAAIAYAVYRYFTPDYLEDMDDDFDDDFEDFFEDDDFPEMDEQKKGEETAAEKTPADDSADASEENAPTEE